MNNLMERERKKWKDGKVIYLRIPCTEIDYKYQQRENHIVPIKP